ncbi:class I SAM-dependent methyltransferase [Sulfurimonas sp.]|jgi:hypothetical protein|uniref:class I SAM-dependent methyltransferase n=1 Tax=Sulfurimonas sp. TaxID=2022749 RepID=UPI0025E7AD42|nr:class I SAM-dependent methyltransferase [Sulfurimonas sp.]MCK9472185.1 class I SAM-dependent methyltransferase [Sulfurimonas sp.]MDD3505899.1 class I SAM-dependent methyltransferase [Sulfurimonas sp.]
MKETVLVFPSSTISSILFAFSAKDNFSLLGASSDCMLSNAQLFDEWKYLPYINSDNFTNEIKLLLSRYKIKKIFAGSSGAWHFLQKFIDEENLDTTLLNTPEHNSSIAYAKSFKTYSNELYDYYSLFQTDTPELSNSEFASMLHNYHKVPGESGDNKFLALTQIAKYIPKGDMVEIGTQQGKSAFLLYAIAKKYNIGKVLCIDPWTNSVQKDSPELIQELGKNTEIDYFFYNFLLNLSLYKDKVNYIKKTSDDAFLDYKTNTNIVSEEFGKTKYTQKIALLHIDGNHDYIYVYNDLKNYSKFLIDGSWILFDDYIWAFGIGPKKVGDSFLEQNMPNIKNCFYTDGTLFVQIISASNIKIPVYSI